MLRIGDFNELEAVEKTVPGVYLEGEGHRILLPNKYIPENLVIGEKINVFIYKDSEDRLIATNLKPLGIVGDIVVLKVKDVNSIGAFLDWGLEKDLLVPHAEQHRKMVAGQNYVVKIVLDPKTDRIIGVGKLNSFLNKDVSSLEKGQKVDLIIDEVTDLGFMAIINKEFRGIIYKNEVFKPLDIGDTVVGYIKKIRDDGKIDLTLYEQKTDEISNAKNVILEKLKANNGSLPFSDKSEPESIKKYFHLSKRNFKMALGALYKEKKIQINEKDIVLISGNK